MPKFSRLNTIEEKRKMRRARRKRIRSRSKLLETQVQLESTLRSEAEKKLVLYKNMCRSYWERWHWELQQRKSNMMIERRAAISQEGIDNLVLKIHEIDPDLLQNPNNQDEEVYIGRGSFAVVQLQTYRGLKVAVKRLLPNTVAADVHKEAQILARLCHPNLPYLFGVVTSKPPYKIVMQYHGLSERMMSVTLSDVLCRPSKLYDQYTFLLFCAQIAEALCYLHDEVKILHNDLKCNNVVICDSISEVARSSISTSSANVQIVLIDFGKATSVDKGKTYKLTDIEKSQYTTKFPHMAPEVINGFSPQSKMSDIYSLGGIFYKVHDHAAILSKDILGKLQNLATNCRSLCCSCRPSAKNVMGTLEKLLN